MVNRTRSNGCMTIDVKSVCRNIGSARSCFVIRVTSVQNHCVSGHRLNNGMGVVFMMIYFSAGLLISVGILYLNCHNQMYMYPWCGTIKCTSRECRIVENFFEGGLNFAENGSCG